MQAKEFINWIFIVERILEFKDDLDDKMVKLVVSRLRGMRIHIVRSTFVDTATKEKITCHKLGKMNKMKRKNFMPFNYTQTIYQNGRIFFKEINLLMISP